MPVTRCPHCRTELDLDAADFGYRVQCPSCHSAFTPEEPVAAPPPLPPPPPPADAPADDTKVVTCPECDGKVGILEADLGHDMRCPLCDRVFKATLGGLPPRATRRDDGDADPPWRGSRSGDLPRYDEDEYDRRRHRRRSRYDGDDDSPRELIAYAQRECSAPGIGLIIIASLGFLNGLFALIFYGAILGGAGGNGGFWAAFAAIPEWQLWLNMGLGLSYLFTSAFLLYAGTQIRQAKHHGVSMIACVICMIPYFSPCCLLGLIFGIIGLVKLNEPRVKRGFDANRPDYQSDGTT